MSSAMPIHNAHSNILISSACSAEVKTEGVRHGSPMKEVKDGKLNRWEGPRSPEVRRWEVRMKFAAVDGKFHLKAE